MTTVSQILQNKEISEVWTVDAECTVAHALEQMIEKNVGALPVVDEKGAVVGIISERDYARKVVLNKTRSLDAPIEQIMTRRVCYVRPEQTIDDCMALMTDKRVRHLPVIDGETLMGIVSIGDVVKVIINNQEFMITQLENYITGAI